MDRRSWGTRQKPCKNKPGKRSFFTIGSNCQNISSLRMIWKCSGSGKIGRGSFVSIHDSCISCQSLTPMYLSLPVRRRHYYAHILIVSLHVIFLDLTKSCESQKLERFRNKTNATSIAPLMMAILLVTQAKYHRCLQLQIY